MSYVSSLYHCVWSTKERQPFIIGDLDDYKSEFLLFLERNQVEYDPR